MHCETAGPSRCELLVGLAVPEHVEVHLALGDVGLVLVHAGSELGLVIGAGHGLLLAASAGTCGGSRRSAISSSGGGALLPHVFHLHRAGACNGVHGTMCHGGATAKSHTLHDGAHEAAHHAATTGALGGRGCS